MAINVTGASVRKLAPETAKVNDCVAIFGMSRRWFFDRIYAGDIRSFLYKRTGKDKGCRLVDLQSVRDYLRKFETTVKN